MLAKPRLAACCFCCTLQKKKHQGVPLMCIQLLLPESEQNLNRLLEAYCSPSPPAPPLAPAASAAGSASDKYSPALGTAAATSGSAAQRTGTGAASGGNALADVVANIVLKNAPTSRKASMCATPATVAGRARSELTQIAAPAVLDNVGSSNISSSLFWQQFSQNLIVVCVTQVKYMLLGQSCLACPGAIALVSNLVHNMDGGALLEAQCEHAPTCAQEFLEGSLHELYEVRQQSIHAMPHRD